MKWSNNRGHRRIENKYLVKNRVYLNQIIWFFSLFWVRSFHFFWLHSSIKSRKTGKHRNQKNCCRKIILQETNHFPFHANVILLFVAVGRLVQCKNRCAQHAKMRLNYHHHNEHSLFEIKTKGKNNEIKRGREGAKSSTEWRKQKIE